MALFFKKKKTDDEFENEDLPALPPLPGEEDMSDLPNFETMDKPKRPSAMPEVSMSPHYSAPAVMSAPTEKTTVFVRIDKYKDIMRTIQDMDARVADLKANLDKIASIKGKEAEIIDGWNAMLQDAKAKLDEVTNKLTKPEA